MTKKSLKIFRDFNVFLLFVALFFSGKFRNYIASAFCALVILFGGLVGLPQQSEAKDVESFTPKLTGRNRPTSNSGFFGRGSGAGGNPGKPNGDDNGGDSFPEYPKNNSIEETQTRIDETEQQLNRLREVTESDSESESDLENDEDVKIDSKLEFRDNTTARTQAGLLYVDKNEEVLIDKVYQEAVRRAKINDPSYDCDFERIQQLATEYIDETKEDRLYAAKETITAVQAETENIFKPGTGQRVYLGINKSGPIKGLDMRVEGVGKWSRITHVDFKNPAGTKIVERQMRDRQLLKENDTVETDDIVKAIVRKTTNQINYWTDQERYSKLNGLVKNPDLPKSTDNILIIVDLFDVPEFEKAKMKQEMISAAEGKIKNMIFLNDKTNI